MESFHFNDHELLYSSLSGIKNCCHGDTHFEIGAHCITAIVFIVL